jgi:uncharacterized phiE125 gp8 family phage protein
MPSAVMSLSRSLTDRRVSRRSREQAPAGLIGRELAEGPTVRAVSLQQAKAFLRVDHSEDDALIGQLLESAEERVESLCALALTEQEVVARFAGPGHYADLPRGPAHVVREATLSRANRSGERDVTASILLRKGRRPRVFRQGQMLLFGGAELAVRYRAGFAVGSNFSDEEQREAVPAAIKHAIRLAVTDAYDKRSSFAVGTVATELPQSTRSVLSDGGFLSHDV